MADTWSMTGRSGIYHCLARTRGSPLLIDRDAGSSSFHSSIIRSRLTVGFVYGASPEMVVVAVTINLSSLETPTDPDRPRITSRYKNSVVGVSVHQEQLRTVVKHCRNELEVWVAHLEDIAQAGGRGRL